MRRAGCAGWRGAGIGPLESGSGFFAPCGRPTDSSPPIAQFSWSTFWKITLTFSLVLPAISTMALVIASASAAFCSPVRPLHICTVMTGIDLSSRSRFVDYIGHYLKY